MVAILQKESLGEYGSGWGWDSTYAHVFDQETTYNDVIYVNGIHHSGGMPRMYTNNGTTLSYCADYVYTNGDILNSLNQMLNQKSCKPNTGNAGNWYMWSTSSIRSNIKNSVCSKGWKLPEYNGEKGYKILTSTYGNENTKLPVSFTLSGYYWMYDGSYIKYRGSEGRFNIPLTGDYGGWIRYFSFSASSSRYYQHNISSNYGYSLRCGGV